MLNTIIQLLKDASILVSLFTLVGCIIQRKSINDTIVSVTKTFLGFILLFAAARVMISPSLHSFSNIFMMAFDVKGIVPNNEVVIVDAMDQLGPKFASAIALGLIGAMVMNLVFARITPLKFVVLSGHHVFFMVSCLTIISLLHGYSMTTSAIMGSVITAVWCVVSPALLVGYCRRIKNVEPLRVSGDFSIGQFGSTSYMLSGFIGDKFGNVDNDIEEAKLPTALGFLTDKNTSTFLVMFLFFLVSALVAGFDKVQIIADHVAKHGHVNVLLFLLKQSGLFAAGVFVLGRGVHMFVEELIPAFKGISDKLIKKSVPAIEIYSLFPYSKNAVFVGFICCTIAGFITMVIIPYFGLPVIVPSLLFTFASGGGSGIIGNATGGVRGCILGSILCGILSTIGSALIFKPIWDAGVHAATTYSTTDFTILGELLHHTLSLFS
ncbi:PTS transporter subunit IIC [Photobacterium toruni]|uniref:Ascorbate-specific PTS system EIIC component n=1 Tax=Photobacterium toruni TaxID=1935446 RepID=A0ABU6LBJ1_9GAMM|nr:PTS transporter subunit IIC [Photobacterium toruni]